MTKAAERTLLRAFEAVAGAPYGARYYRVDLHLHTPASEDARGSNRYGFNPFREMTYPAASDDSWATTQAIRQAQETTLAQAQTIAAAIVDRFIAEGLRLVAITDHNALGTIWPDPEGGSRMDLAAPTWYELIDDAAAHRHKTTGEAVAILPGVEISTTGIHILGLFPPTSPRRKVHFQICDLLTEIGIDVDEFGRNPASGHASPRDAIDRIHAKGGIAIIAHIDGSDKALLELYAIGNAELAKVLCHPRLRGVEMVDPGKLQAVPKKLAKKGSTLGEWIEDQRFKAGQDGLGFFQGSDAHDLSRIGARSSYLMMSEPGFAGLASALLSPSSRIRVGDLVDAEAPEGALYVHGFAVDHPHFGRISARFNRNLNCVVGATGCGKSLLLALLQHAVSEAPAVDGFTGSVQLLLQRREGERWATYGFTRRANAAPEVFALETSETGTVCAEALARDDPRLPRLRPRFYDHARMAAILSDAAALQGFLETYVGPPSAEAITTFNDRFNFPRLFSVTPDPLLTLEIDDDGAYALSFNRQWRRGRAKLQGFERCSEPLARMIVVIIVLVSGRSGPVIIDEPADLFDNEDISRILVPLIKLLKGRGQMILATKDANLAINSDPENYLVLEHAARAPRKSTLVAGFAIDHPTERERLIALLEGDLAAFERRGRIYSGA